MMFSCIDEQIKLQERALNGWWHQTNKIIKQKKRKRGEQQQQKVFRWDTISPLCGSCCCGFWPEITIEERVRRRLQKRPSAHHTAGIAFYEAAPPILSIHHQSILNSRQLLVFILLPPCVFLHRGKFEVIIRSSRDKQKREQRQLLKNSRRLFIIFSYER